MSPAVQTGLARTPLLLSATLSAHLLNASPAKTVSTAAYLKLDCAQPSGSFKDRGMAHMCKSLQAEGATQIVSSSGGNAGLAAATMGKRLGLDVRVIVPTTTKPLMLDKMRAQDADVTIHGENWNAADELARTLVDESDGKAAYVPPFEDPLLWEGHSTIVDELAADGVKPGAIVASVGGGGLLCGLLLGLRRHGWDDVDVYAAETEGACCFAAGFEAGEPVRLDAITSVATSLGALAVSPNALRLANEHGRVHSVVVTDAEAVGACASLLDDHRVLVEPACGAALALGYSPRLREKLQKHESVVFVVCGGSGVDRGILQKWLVDLDLV